MHSESLQSVIRQQLNIVTSMTQSVSRNMSYARYEPFTSEFEIDALMSTGRQVESVLDLQQCLRKVP